MTIRRLSSVAYLLAAGLVLAACGSSPETTVGNQPGSASGSDSSTSGRPDTQPTSHPPSGMTGPGQTVAGARLVYFDVLGFQPGDFPPQVTLAARVDGVRGLAVTYAGVPGIEKVVNAVNSISSLTSSDILYVFVLTPCTPDDPILQVSAEAVTVKLTGSSAVKCEPPPVRMAVFAVPSASVPASATPMPPTY